MLKGHNIIIKFNGVAIAALKSVEINVSCKTDEVSDPTQGEWKKYLAGRKDWSVSATWLVATAAAMKTNILTVGQTYTLLFGDTTGATLNYLSGTAICTEATASSNVNDLVKGSFRFKGSGAIS